MEENFSLSEDAQHELYRISCYYEYLEKHDDFFSHLIRQLNFIKKMPYCFQVRYKDVRIVSLERHSYSIHYRIIKENIYVIHILNQKQDF